MPSQAQSLPLPQAGGYMWGLSAWAGRAGPGAGASPSPSQLSEPAGPRAASGDARAASPSWQGAYWLPPGPPRSLPVPQWPGTHPKLEVPKGRAPRVPGRDGRIMMMMMPVARAAHLGQWHAGASSLAPSEGVTGIQVRSAEGGGTRCCFFRRPRALSAIRSTFSMPEMQRHPNWRACASDRH